MKKGDKKSIVASLKCLHELPCPELLQNYLFKSIGRDDDLNELEEKGLDSIKPLLLHQNEKIVKGTLLCLGKWVQAKSSIDQKQLEEFYAIYLKTNKPTLLLHRINLSQSIIERYHRKSRQILPRGKKN